MTHIYLFNFVFLAFMSFMSLDINGTKKKYMLYAFVLMVFVVVSLFISGFREYGYNVDDGNYIRSFVEQAGSFDYLYTLVERLLYYFDLKNPQYLVFTLALINTTLIMRALPKHVFLLSFGLLILFSHVYMYRHLMQVRAAIAYNLVLIAFLSLAYKNNYKAFVIYVLLGIGFHLSAVGAFAALVFKKVNIPYNRYWFYLLICVVASFFLTSQSINGLAAYFPNFLSQALHKYLIVQSKQTVALSVINPTTIKSIFVLIFLVLFQIKGDKGYKLLTDLYFLSVCVLVLFRDFAVFSSRTASMFAFVEIILIPLSIYSMRDGMQRWIVLTGYIVCYSLILYLNIAHKNLLSRVVFLW